MLESVGPVDSGDSGPLPDLSPFEQAADQRESRQCLSQTLVIRAIPSLRKTARCCRQTARSRTRIGQGIGQSIRPELVGSPVPWFIRALVHTLQDRAKPHSMNRLHLHLVSDSTGETLEMVAKAALAQFEDTEIVRHFWPMVRSRQHLDRIVPDLAANPGLVLFTLVNAETRTRLEEHCRQLGLPAVAALDAVTEALETQLGQEAHGRPGRQHTMDEAYFRRVEALHYTIAHDDGIGCMVGR